HSRSERLDRRTGVTHAAHAASGRHPQQGPARRTGAAAAGRLLVRLESGQVVKDPNREVHDRITLVFHTLLAQKTLTNVVRHFRAHGLKIPRRDHWGDIHWKPADNAALSEMVHNPAYAGTYAWGRSRWVKSPHTGRAQQVRVPREQWRVCLHDHYPAYISWKDFESIEAMLQDNHAEYKRNRTRGVPREGKALLQG